MYPAETPETPKPLLYSDASIPPSSASSASLSLDPLHPSTPRLVKRLRAACVLGGAARLVAGLAGVGEHPAAAAAAGQAGAGPGAQQGAGQGSGTSGGGTGSRRGWSWWPFGRRTAKPPPQADQGAPAASSAPAAPDTPPSPASAPSPAPSLPPRGVLLSSSDVLLGRAIAALEGATQAGQELLQVGRQEGELCYHERTGAGSCKGNRRHCALQRLHISRPLSISQSAGHVDPPFIPTSPRPSCP